MKHLFHSLPIKLKMFFTFASVYVIIITIIGLLIYISNVNAMKDQAQSMSKVLSNQSSRTIDLYVQDIERVSLAIFSDSFIQETLSAYEGKDTNYDISIKNTMYSRLSNQAYPRPDIEGITIYTNSGSVFDYNKSGGMAIRYENEEKEWMNSLDQMKKSDFLLLPTNEVTLINGDKEKVFSLVRHIYEIPSRKKIGSLKVDINIQVFEQMLEIDDVEELEEHVRILVMSGNKKVIYDDTKELIGQQIGLELPRVKEGNPEEGKLTWLSDSYLYANDHSDYTNWDTVILIENGLIIYERNQILLFIGISGIIVILIIAVLSYFLSHNIAKPLVKIMEKMKKVEKGDLTDRMELTGNSDVDVLTRVYNSMLDSINNLIKEVYESSIAEKNAKISALQSQINPHFLYNTLNIMKSISRVKGVEEVAEISESLADLFKYSMRDLDKQVSLYEEFSHIKNYIRIQQHRFKDRFVVEEDVSREVQNVLIPKLLLQPVVENAVIHGLADTKKHGVIKISANRDNDHLIVTVADNGKGMNRETLEKVKEKLNGKVIDSEHQGVGLSNIAQRIKLMYGSPYQIEMFSEEGEGTFVRIVLPYCHV